MSKKYKTIKMSGGYEVHRTDADGTEYTKDGLRIEHDYDMTIEDRRISVGLQWASCKLTIPGAVKNAWKLDTNLAQVYEIENFMTKEECEKTINLINCKLEQSGITGGSPSTYRTSRTNYLAEVDSEWAKVLDYRTAEVLGVNPVFAEAIQGQRYDKTQYFKEHVDWFDVDAYGEEDDTIRRIWSAHLVFMVYLNDVKKGGETTFRRLGKLSFLVKVLFWFGTIYIPRCITLHTHEALPVLEGNKWSTKWFRQKPSAQMWDTK